MLFDDCNIQFQGFHPSDFTRSYLNDKMSALHEETPYGASLKATFSRNDADFKGVVTIHSSAGKFFAVATGRKLKEVTQKLMEQIRKQLDRWKTNRFQHQSLKDLETMNTQHKEVNYDTETVA